MKVKDLKGHECNWCLDKYMGKQSTNPSQLHLRARKFLAEYFPACQILEEVYLPGDKLYLDFYIPYMHIAIECQGQQHNNFTAYFHKNIKGFGKAVSRDARKLEWCHQNRIDLVYFNPEETEKEWQTKLDQL